MLELTRRRDDQTRTRTLDCFLPDDTIHLLSSYHSSYRIDPVDRGLSLGYGTLAQQAVVG